MQYGAQVMLLGVLGLADSGVGAEESPTAPASSSIVWGELPKGKTVSW